MIIIIINRVILIESKIKVYSGLENMFKFFSAPLLGKKISVVGPYIHLQMCASLCIEVTLIQMLFSLYT